MIEASEASEASEAIFTGQCEVLPPRTNHLRFSSLLRIMAIKPVDVIFHRYEIQHNVCPLMNSCALYWLPSRSPNGTVVSFIGNRDDMV